VSEKELLFVDTETYSNKAFFGARTESGREFRYWVRYAGENTDNIREIINSKQFIFVTFNGIYFDLPVIGAMYAGKDPEYIKRVANQIIQHEVKPWVVTKEFELAYKKVQQVGHIDLMRVVTAPAVGLKMYGARMHAPNIMENPFHHEATIKDEDEPAVERYCVEGDLDLTQRLFQDLIKPIELRVTMSHEYGIDMRCKTDAQMAEAVFVKRLQLTKKYTTRVPESVRYSPPDYLKFKNPVLQAILEQAKEAEYFLNDTGHIELPAFLHNRIVEVGKCKYKMGIGGLHSAHDKKICYIAEDGWIIDDIDATSYYPTIILLGSLVPKNLGAEFLQEYRIIYNRRLEAKRLKDQSSMDVLRIALNGTYGKLTDKFSPLYSPDLGLYIVLTGQFTLLQVAELLEEVGCEILSANTDGMMIRYRVEDKEKVAQVLSDYTKNVGYVFEQTQYRCVAMKDVNNYFAVKMDRTLKTKGLYAKQDLRKNPSGMISALAVGEWLAHGTPVAKTIMEGKLKDFLFARNVKKLGCMYGDEWIGNTVRWYKTTNPSPRSFTYRGGGAKIARTDNGAALMSFDPAGAHPSDLDYEAYTREAIRIIQDVGAAKFLTADEALLLPQPKRRKKKSNGTSP